MSYTVSISHDAEVDLWGIYAYIYVQSLVAENAQGQISRLEQVILSLGDFPARHRLVSFEPWKSRGLRVMLCDNFLIFYFVFEEKHEVIVSRVLYGKRDIEKVINDD